MQQVSLPRGDLILAILLGLLTFVVTGLITLIIASLFFFLGKIFGNFNPIIIIARIFGLRELGGFFAAQFILIAVFALLGDFVTAIISWFLNQSKKLAAITFFSALFFQILVTAFVTPAVLKKSQETMNRGIARENSYKGYATIGEVNVNLQELFKFPYALNGRLTEVSLFKRLVFTVPVSVSRAGKYQIYVRYVSNSSFYANSKSPPNIIKSLDVGDHLVNIELIAGAAANLGYESPKLVNGKVLIDLSYLVSKKDLLNSIKSDSTIDQKIYEQFIKDEELNQRINPDPTVSKFVARKEVQF